MKPQPVESPDDPRLAPFRSIRDRSWLRARGQIVLEGRAVVELAVRAGLESECAAGAGSRREGAPPGADAPALQSLLVTPTALAALEPLLIGQPELDVLLASRALMRATSGVAFHQGCVGLARAPVPRTAEEVLEALGPRALVLVIEDVTDPDNVGGLFRNARAFGVDAVLLSARCASPYYRKSIRTSLGATLRIPFAHADVLALAELDRAGFAGVALTPAADAQSLSACALELTARPRLALCVGNEGQGLSAGVQGWAERRVRIPMADGADSLNVATAAAVALHAFSARAEGEH